MVLGPEISAYIISYTPSFTPLSKMPHHTSSDSSRHSDPLYHCESHCFTIAMQSEHDILTVQS